MAKKLRIEDYRGEQFNSLTILDFVGRDSRGQTMANCKCDCGQEKVIRLADVKSGRVRSCGCLLTSFNNSTKRTHGLSNSKLYQIWKNMVSRCHNPENDKFYNYGGRGIFVCDEWRNDFTIFYLWAIKTDYTGGLSIERKDNDTGYSPGNCTWIPIKEQPKHTRRVKQITLFGETKNLSQWLRDDRVTVSERKYYELVKSGLTEAEALSHGQPV